MKNFTPISDPVKKQLLTQLYEQLDIGIFILDASLRYLSVNAVYEILLGYKERFLLGRPLGVYAAEFLGENERAILNDIASYLNEVGLYKKTFSMSNRYGQTINCHITFQRIRLDTVDYYVGIIRDISSIAKDRAKVTYLQNFDQLTGLPNRKVFLSQVSELLLDTYQEIVVVRFNIDRYRHLASALGLDKIDSLILAFVNRVNELQMQNLYCFSHFGGDDFALLFECDDANLIRNQLDSLMQVSERPYLLSELVTDSADDSLVDSSLVNGLSVNDSSVNELAADLVSSGLLTDTKIYLHLSVGVSYFPKYGNQLMGLLAQAEKALHYVKEQGGDDVCWYHYDLEQVATGSLQLESELRMAIDDYQFVAHYQPKVILKTGAIVGFEALVRWQHPTRGLLRPNDFIEGILRYKLSFALFCQMAIQIAKQLSYWQSLGLSHYVCINADAAEFSHPNFFEFFSGLFTQYSILPQQLHIEVTESSLMLRDSHVKQQLLALKGLGVCLELDDFGTGYASLSYLQEYPFDVIKIDKSFLSKLVEDKTQQAIVKAILDLAAALEMGIIAEGIETEQQLDLLIKMGCHYGQGYLFSRPISHLAATEMLVDQSKLY